MRTNRWIVIGVLMVFCFMSSVALAQGRRGGGGRGGFGGGFGFGGGGFGGGKLGLLRMEEVQKEIEIDEDQKAELDKLNEEIRGDGGQNRNFQDLSDEERQKLFQEFQERTQKAEAKLGDILLPHQMDRLEQLSIQQRGTAALSDEKVAEKLELTDEQKEKLKTVQEEVGNTMRDEARKIFQENQDGGGGGDAFAKLAELRKEAETKILDVLTDGQKKTFEEMKGEPFEFPRPQFGRGGRGGGGRGGRGGRGGGDGGRPEGDNN